MQQYWKWKWKTLTHITAIQGAGIDIKPQNGKDVRIDTNSALVIPSWNNKPETIDSEQTDWYGSFQHNSVTV